ncbi:MAG: nucleotide exchange factor GrpE [Burkholderiaceae bacterium]
MAEPERAAEVKDAAAAPAVEVENEPAALPSASVSEVESELQAALAKANENYELFLRAKAEAENVRRRAQEDIAKAHKYAIESFAADLLPVMDSLEKALETDNATVESMRQGIELTLRQLKAAFEKSRLTAIDPKGEKFDPYRHQAISTVPATAACPPNQVAAVFQKGWMIAERVLRPAMVAVARGEEATSAHESGA